MYTVDGVLHLSIAQDAPLATCDNPKYAVLPFYKNGHPLMGFDDAMWGMSFMKAGSMRFRWNEANKNRDAFFTNLLGESKILPLSIELLHSKIVYVVRNISDIAFKSGDGIITTNENFLPVVTVADCMPIFLFDPITHMFGVLHSGWRGTGIVSEALRIAYDVYGTNASDVCVAFGPHIRECCYIVDSKRATYFKENFGDDCAQSVDKSSLQCCTVPDWKVGSGDLFRLSLERANINILAKAGVLKSNITAVSDCTCCNNLYGSHRRETYLGKKNFTAQAAFCGHFRSSHVCND